MPTKSLKQFRFLKAAANHSLKSAGPSPEVAKKLLSHEDRKKKFAKSK